ncbi:peptidase M48 [Mycobacteroides chelonae]|jgi:Zn-dependent protease with chaperone function|uniref:Peptidase M48 n=1 Tax=Mycobacteroides chelonae TaxID=1774 RepID=A0A1S1LUJ3_MYCCH|nr:M56 family metallopeptidase [Mycobacteroides chelonae]PKQ57535.1 peptidase M48 [Mycobacterium sp. MHSD3]SKL33730.1 Zn-dependent protease with chaperone function [Mycobacteroides abscessus subsp. bolletii]MBF9523963.1 M56 family metallopeptidase [Mycobacteroides chelonae]OHU57259.1 peptidase M48 [Mycobacteroides chelonae]OHU76019.1 peptidase M48 [Mycobacteroides chelonae]
MSIAVCLLLYSVAVLIFGPRLLRRLTRTGYAPRLAITAWLAAIVSVLGTWISAAALIVIDVVRHWNSPAVVLAACAARLHAMLIGQAGAAAQVGLLALSAAGSIAAAALGVRLARTLIRLRDTAHEHAYAVHMVGRRTAEGDVMVLEAPEAAAYCVAGRPSAIVLTTGALAILDDAQVAAILAHERAHLAGHHPQLVSVLRALADVFPRVRLMTDGSAQISRLLEMCADDSAARHHGRGVLLSGLMDLAGTVPAAAVGAANVAVLDRAERLLTPPEPPARAWARIALTMCVAAISAGPLVTIALATSGALLCSP